MNQRVAIVWAGYTPFRTASPDVSYREMIFEVATMAYSDAGITPGGVDTFISLSEDYLEGTAIADGYVPDQLGAVLKPVHTIASIAMQLETEQFYIAVVEGRYRRHSSFPSRWSAQLR